MKKTILFVIFFLSIHSAVFGSGFPSLKLGADAQVSAMGFAGTALAENGASSFWNPATLSFIQGKKLIFSYHRWIQDVQSQFIGFGTGFSNMGFGVHLLYTEVGGIEHRVIPTPEPLGTFSNHEIAAGISFAYKAIRSLSIGLSMKLYYQKLFIEESTGLGGDVGVLYEVWRDGLRIGGAVQNIGKTGKLKEEPIELPLMAKFGFAVPVSIGDGRLLCAVDGVQEKDFPFHLQGGLEYSWQNLLYLRLGYQSGYETRWMTGGIGICWHGIHLDYSNTPLRSDLGDAHFLSLGFEW